MVSYDLIKSKNPFGWRVNYSQGCLQRGDSKLPGN